MSVNYQNIEIMCRKQEEQSANNASKSRCEQEETIGGHFISSVKLEYKQGGREGWASRKYARQEYVRSLQLTVNQPTCANIKSARLLNQAHSWAEETLGAVFACVDMFAICCLLFSGCFKGKYAGILCK